MSTMSWFEPNVRISHNRYTKCCFWTNSDRLVSLVALRFLQYCLISNEMEMGFKQPLWLLWIMRSGSFNPHSKTYWWEWWMIYTFNYTHIKYLDLNLLYSSGQLLIVKARTFIESQGQSPQSRPVLRVTGVAASQYVVPGLLVQEPQHGLVFHLRAAVTTVISSDRQKCQQSSIRILFSSVELFNWTFSIRTTWRITSPSGGFSRKVRRKLPAAL